MNAAIGEKGSTLGVNGLGRIGKLTVWLHAGRKYFDKIVVNVDRDAGAFLPDVAHYMHRIGVVP